MTFIIPFDSHPGYGQARRGLALFRYPQTLLKVKIGCEWCHFLVFFQEEL